MRRAVGIVDGLDVDGLMQIALRATQGTYPHPNPRVGAVVVSPTGEVLATGACHGDGLPHAEVNALLGVPDPTGATIAVTLEPCDHHGRTPPCSQAIIDAGIKRVIVGAVDPDHRVAGRGIARLQEAGIDVIVDVATDAVIANDPGYFHHRITGRPRVTLKMASTLDGQVAATDGTSQWITGDEARSDAHRLRSEHDAVLVGSGTVRIDDPLLTVRTDGYDGPQPVPVILAGDRPIPPEAALLTREAVIYGHDSPGYVEVDEVLADLGERGIVSVMVEGGPRVARSFLDADAVDNIVWYLGAKVAGGAGQPAIDGAFATIADAVSLRISEVAAIGSDVRISAVPESRV